MVRKEKANRGSRMPSEFVNGGIYAFAKEYRLMLNALPKAKSAHKPKYDTMFTRKFMILVYLSGVERDLGHFSVYSIRDHFKQSDSGYADNYFSKLLSEGWAIAINTHYKKHREAILSPLFYSLIQSITNTLRREHPERFRAQDIAALSPKVQAMKPESSTLDMIETITDNR